DYITRLASRDPQAEILFYYAGHGLPDEQTKEPYLIPVDVNATSLSSAIALYDMYKKLSATNASKIMVFLDACFSGGGRDMGLLASRGVRVTPKKTELTGNIVVFSATSENQTALPYWDKKHGMFTYFLLKKLQDSKGACSYSELSDYLTRQVGENSLRENRKDQTPEVNTSRQVSDEWGEWKF
ncbi:MAG: caspase family protein, partial [Bacteroidales bacterium]|nr:caspase family protein [Bacteroidales bacterium]